MLRLGVVLAVLSVALAEPTTYFKEQFEDGAFAQRFMNTDTVEMNFHVARCIILHGWVGSGQGVQILTFDA